MSIMTEPTTAGDAYDAHLLRALPDAIAEYDVYAATHATAYEALQLGDADRQQLLANLGAEDKETQP